MMQEFVAVAAHELRGPMSVIRGFAALAETRWGDLGEPAKLDMVGAIARSSERLGRLIDDLLVLSRLDAGASDGEAARIGLADAVIAALDDLGSSSAGIEVRIGADVTVVARDHQVRRIVRNYVENALRYGRPPIVIDALVDADHVDVRIRDEGDGVPVGMEERVFEPFASADQASSRAQGGSGLGLSIVRGLARANGGDAWYEPNEPHGSSFTVRLPVNPDLP
jgi:signal transduction histidine kinase